MWTAVLRNLTGRAAKSLPMGARLRLLQRAATSILDYRLARWPLSATTAREVDAFQRKCMVVIQSIPRKDGDDLDTWYRKKQRAAGDLARSQGLWSIRHRDRATSWFEHINRPRNSMSVSSLVFKHKNHAWRVRRRIEMGSSSATAGRLNCRAISHVQAQWEDSLLR